MLTPDIPKWVRGWSLWVPLPPSQPGKPKKWISLNERQHWGGRSSKTSLWRAAASEAARMSGIPRLERAWVQTRFTFGNTRRRDTHNLGPTSKACIDGFTDAGLWSDDADGIFVGPDPRRDPEELPPQKRKGKEAGITFLIFELAA